MKRSPAVFLFFFILILHSAFAQEQDSIPRKIYETRAVTGEPPVIDGKLDDEAWLSVGWGGDFVQRSPYEGKAPTQNTQFKILYDARYLYIAFRCYDTEPDSIVKRMSRRDGFEGDWVEVNIDSYHDKRTAFSFTTSVSGVKGDEFISNNGGNWDTSWNPIWNTKTNVDSLGWSAEVRIPLSQVRYGNKEEQVWGLQFTRRDFREESRSVWQFIPQNSGNWVSSFGELRGLEGIKPQKQIEIQPYIVAQAETFEKEEGNPFATGSDYKFTGGVDGKVGLTSDLTLDFTINPDFGQVEADPSVLTLDGFRIFFSERRPFFVENRNLFDYGYTYAEAGGPFTSDNLFYSRRIGGSPHGSPDLQDGEYADVPDFTAILGAAKFSGKTKSGLGIGILESVTSRETARIDFNGERRNEVVEPLTNYFVGRVTQDFNEGETVVGGIFTATKRDLDGTGLDFLRKDAYTGGIDFQHWWKGRTWLLTANGVFSRVDGSAEAILNTQTSFEHLFQRPGAKHVEVDSAATSLVGTGGMVKVGRLNKKWMLETGVTWRSPELELNDIGFMTNTDEINYFLWTGYRWTDPFSIFRRLQLNYNHWLRWDFGGNNLYQAVNTNLHATFKNFWGLGGGVTYENKDISNNALFGGPVLRRSKGIAPWFYFYSDQRKIVQFQANCFFAQGFEKGDPRTVHIEDYSIWVGIQPTNALNFSVGPGYNRNERKIQYVTGLDFQDDTRYIAGTVDQRTFSATFRLNYSITPDLTLQYYGQPFISRGRYEDYKYITDPMAESFDGRFHLYSDAEIGYDAQDEEFEVDENLDGVADYTFSEPDFNFIQYRSNMVARWEYTPGSELFLVWSQGVTNMGNPEDKLIPSLTDNLFSEKARNIFLLKLTYRFLR